jgi:hypothetical protein
MASYWRYHSSPYLQILRKGNRPSFTKAAPPAVAIPLYETFKQKMSDFLDQPNPVRHFRSRHESELTQRWPRNDFTRLKKTSNQ